MLVLVVAVPRGPMREEKGSSTVISSKDLPLPNFLLILNFEAIKDPLKWRLKHWWLGGNLTENKNMTCYTLHIPIPITLNCPVMIYPSSRRNCINKNTCANNVDNIFSYKSVQMEVQDYNNINTRCVLPCL